MEEPRREAEVGVEGGRVLTGVLGVRGGLEVGARAAKCNPVEVRCAPNRLIHTTDFDLIIVFKVCICIEARGKEHHYPLLNV